MIWWRDAVCYEIYPRSFADTDGDGTGDLPGITRHLDHIRDLGADAIWITPCYPSPLADGGYDIADHTAIADDLGTLEDFTTLTVGAHAMGLKVIVDVVPNHSSDAHPWFRAALAAGPGSAARERYLFRTGRGPGGAQPPNDWESAFGGPAWTRVPDGEWYLHLHAPEQPDFNWRDPHVRAEFSRVLRFWLDQGVDGFRIDVAHALFKAEGLPDAGPGQHQDPARNHLMPYYDQEELHPLYREWRTLLDTHPAPPGAVAPGERVLVAESAVFEPDRLARYVRADEMQQAFNFAFLEAPWRAPELRRVIDESLAATAAVDAPVTWVMSSHDAPRPATRLGSELRAGSAALLMLALPGAVYLYQGRSWACRRRTCPMTASGTRCGGAPTARTEGGTAHACRSPGVETDRRTGSPRPRPRPAGFPSPRAGAGTPSPPSVRTRTPCCPSIGEPCGCDGTTRSPLTAPCAGTRRPMRPISLSPGVG